MKEKLFVIIPLLSGFGAINANAAEDIENLKPKGCIVSVETGNEYCLPVGERSGYSLPDWINGQEVYVNAAPGAKVLLSDWDNLSYNRIAGFIGTVESKDLNNKLAWNGDNLNFSHPRSMRVIRDGEPLGCIVSVETGKEYCLPVGERSSYSLPDWINGQEVYVNAAPGTEVVLSDLDNLSYNRIAGFVGTVETENLNNKQYEKRSWGDEILNFSHPHSMQVISNDEPLGCIVSVETGKEYCLPVGERSDYSLPDWINGQEVYVNAAPGTEVVLSDWNNLSYNRIAGFVGTVKSENLNNKQYEKRSWGDEILNFSHPRSMQVVSSK